jgi:hypothetical protein
MKFNAIGLPARLKRIVALILIAGFGAAIIVYVTAAPGPVGSTGYDPADSKRDLREMEIYGGKANLLAGELRHWFASLWHGRNLAFTVALLTVALALAVLFFGVPLPPVTGPEPGSQDNREGPSR